MEEDTGLPRAPLAVEIPTRRRSRSELQARPIKPIKALSISPTSPRHPFAGQKPKLDPSDLCQDYEPSRGHDGISAWSASSEKQLVGSPGGASDRVFPIRSVVSVDPSQTPGLSLGRSSAEIHEEYFPPGSAGHDITGVPQQRRQTMSIAEADSRESRDRRDTDFRMSRENSRANRKSSISATWSESARYGGGSRMQIFSDVDSERSSNQADSLNAQSTPQPASTGSYNSADQEDMNGLVTARFKHIVTAGGHAGTPFFFNVHPCQKGEVVDVS